MTVRNNENLTMANRLKEINMSEFIADWQTEPLPRSKALQTRHLAIAASGGDNQTAFIMTTDLDSGNDAQSLAAVHGLDLQIRFPRDGWPSAAVALFIALDELLLDARDRREYLAQLRTAKLRFPIVVLSYDFYLDRSTVVRPGLMLAVRLDEDVIRALRKGHIDPPTAENDGRKAA